MESEELNDEDIIINKVDSLRLIGGVESAATDRDSVTAIGELEEEETAFTSSNSIHPNSIIIVTNIIEPVFTAEDAKVEFESLFLQHDPEAQFQYLRCFRRARVLFSSVEKAEKAHRSLENSEILGQPFHCYFAQPITLPGEGRQHLEPPPADKQFLISPPSSPPVGWEVITERQPAINYDLIAAMAKLGPGESYELHHGNENQPSIVVHICEDPVGYEKRPPKIQQTRCPDRKP